jgi:hypothetical protein
MSEMTPKQRFLTAMQAGGVIAQFELTPGSNPATTIAIFEEWEKVQS